MASSGFRNPRRLPKWLPVVDVVSKGRLKLGIGAGVQKEEHLAYGMVFPRPKSRNERMKEAGEIMKKLWTEEKLSYEGKHFKIAEAVSAPKPMQKPHPPMIIGGCVMKLTLRLTAQHAQFPVFINPY